MPFTFADFVQSAGQSSNTGVDRNQHNMDAYFESPVRMSFGQLLDGNTNIYQTPQSQVMSSSWSESPPINYDAAFSSPRFVTLGPFGQTPADPPVEDPPVQQRRELELGQRPRRPALCNSGKPWSEHPNNPFDRCQRKG